MSTNEDNNQETSSGEEFSKDSETQRQSIHWGRMNEDTLEYGRELDKQAMELLAEMKREGIIS